MTRDEAKTKWCPMPRLSVSGVVILANRPSDDRSDLCLANDCALWTERAGYDGALVGRCGLVRE